MAKWKCVNCKIEFESDSRDPCARCGYNYSVVQVKEEPKPEVAPPKKVKTVAVTCKNCKDIRWDYLKSKKCPVCGQVYKSDKGKKK